MSFTSATCLIYAIYPVPPTILQAWEGKNFRLEASLDVGATVAGSSDENIGFMSGMSARSLTALRHFAIGSSAYRRTVSVTEEKKNSVTISVTEFDSIE